MIVVDSNVLLSLYLHGPNTDAARAQLEADGDWCAPILWRSEFRNVLSRYVRSNLMTLPQAIAWQAAAEELMLDRDYPVESDRVLTLAQASGCSAYDCEFVALAESLGVALITLDQRLLSAFPRVARALA